MVRVMILDDHDLARHSCRQTLAAERDIDVVADTRAIGQAIDLLASTRPHAVIVDTLRADGDGIAAARSIRAADPSVRMLLLVADSGTQACAAALLAGAQGYVRRNAKGAAAAAVRLVAQGHRLLETADILTTQAWINRQLHADSCTAQSDSTVRDGLLDLVLAGHTDPDIMTRLLISQRHIDLNLAEIIAVLHLPGAATPPVLHLSTPGKSHRAESQNS